MRVERLQFADYVTDLVRDAEYLFLISYKGLSVAQFNELRELLAETGAVCQVLKNSYLRLGLKNNDIDLPDGTLRGDTAVVLGHGDPCAPAKIVRTFGRKHAVVSFKGGVLDGAAISAADATLVANLPPLEVVQAQLLGLLQAPATGLVQVLNAKMASIVYALKAYVDKQSEPAQ